MYPPPPETGDGSDRCFSRWLKSAEMRCSGTLLWNEILPRGANGDLPSPVTRGVGKDTAAAAAVLPLVLATFKSLTFSVEERELPGVVAVVDVLDT